MIRKLIAGITLTALATTACGPSPKVAEADGSAAAATLAEARARAQDLANSAQNYQPVRFVSEIEQVKRPRPVEISRPAPLTERGAELVAIDSTPTSVSAAAPEARPASVLEDDDTPRVPSIIAREAPLPPAVGGRADAWQRADPGPDMETVIGVVLRGGLVDPGHCPRHPRPPSQIPHRIPR
jgi:hypothetical protein